MAIAMDNADIQRPRDVEQFEQQASLVPMAILTSLIEAPRSDSVAGMPISRTYMHAMIMKKFLIGTQPRLARIFVTATSQESAMHVV